MVSSSMEIARPFSDPLQAPTLRYFAPGQFALFLSIYCFGQVVQRSLMKIAPKRSENKKKVQVGKDQEKAQSEKDSHSKNQGGKKPNQQSGTYTMKTFRKPNEKLFSQ